MILQLIKKERIILNMQAKTKDEALKELIKPLELGPEKEKLLFETLKKREEIGTTGIGHGIAIPHARSTVVGDVNLVIGRSKEGVDFDSLDGKPVHIFFLIVAPPNDPGTKYLIALGEVARMAKRLIEHNEYLDTDDLDRFYKLLRDIAKEVE